MEDGDLAAQALSMAARWLGYVEAFIVAIIGTVVRMAYLAVTNGELYSRQQIVALLLAGGGAGFALHILLPIEMPARVFMVWCGGFLGMYLLNQLSKNGPAWITRVIQGPGTPLDDER